MFTQKKVAAGDKWNPDSKRWQLPYREVVALGLEEWIEQDPKWLYIGKSISGTRQQKMSTNRKTVFLLVGKTTSFSYMWTFFPKYRHAKNGKLGS